jgi:hypothetical protein
MSGLDIREMLELIASYDGRDISLIDIEAWSEQAIRGQWNRQDTLDAVLDFYARDPRPCWSGTNEPRPVLPADIHTHHDQRRTT